MKRMLTLTMVGLLVTILALSGCGYLKKKEFEREFYSYKQDVAGNFKRVDEDISGLDKKVDKVSNSVKEEAQKAKEEAIRAAEEGDADTIEAVNKKIETGDKEVLAAAKRAAAEAEENAKKAALAETKKSVDQAMEVAKKADESATHANAIAENAIDENKKLKEELNDYKARNQIASKPLTVNFRPGKVDISESDAQKLEQVVELLKKYPGSKIRIEGHTDVTPIRFSRYKSNWDLADARAKAIRDYLMNNLGVTGENIELIPRSMYQPVSSQMTTEGMELNRRVDVYIIPPMTAETSSAGLDSDYQVGIGIR